MLENGPEQKTIGKTLKNVKHFFKENLTCHFKREILSLVTDNLFQDQTVQMSPKTLRKRVSFDDNVTKHGLTKHSEVIVNESADTDSMCDIELNII